MKLDCDDQRRLFRAWLLRIATNTPVDRRGRGALRRTEGLMLERSTNHPDVETETHLPPTQRARCHGVAPGRGTPTSPAGWRTAVPGGAKCH